MLAGMMEKFAFGGALVLYWQRRLALQVLVFGLIDLDLAVLFAAAFIRSKPLV